MTDLFGFQPWQPYEGEQDQGSDFFDAVLGASRAPISQLFGVMDPLGAMMQRVAEAQQPTEPTTFQRNVMAMPATGLAGRPTGFAGAAGSAAHVAPGISGQVGQASTRSTKIAQKIITTAASLGLDPEFALWVAENEGGLDDAAANRRNRQGSHAYGPYQLLVGGGLGDAAIKAGIDPRDATTWERQIEFALQHVAQNGWRAWEAVTARGIDPWTGTPRKGGYAAPHVPAPAPGLSVALSPQSPIGTGIVPLNQLPAGGPLVTLDQLPRPAPGTNPYQQMATTPASEYAIAFDFDQAYSSPWSPKIPRHRGVDLTVKGAPNGGRGSRVGAFHGGTVISANSDPAGGNGIILRADDGLYHYYGHFDSLLARAGQRVERGTPLGMLGASGTEGFPHLHFEVRRGQNGDPMGQLIDPRPYLNGAR